MFLGKTAKGARPNMERINQKKVEQLDDYIREGKLKPALKLVESRQKKGDKSDSLLVH